MSAHERKNVKRPKIRINDFESDDEMDVGDLAQSQRISAQNVNSKDFFKSEVPMTNNNSPIDLGSS